MISYKGKENELVFNRGFLPINRVFITLELRLSQLSKGSKKTVIHLADYTYNDRFVNVTNLLLNDLAVGMYKFQLVANSNLVIDSGILHHGQVPTDQNEEEGSTDTTTNTINGTVKYKYFNG